jgi:hypothetical protein
MTKFTFTDRASYLTYRANWKHQYLTVTGEIRKLKQQRAEANRAFSKTNGSYNKEWSALANTLNALAASRKEAAELLIELSEAKLEAGRQYNAAKEPAMS